MKPRYATKLICYWQEPIDYNFSTYSWSLQYVVYLYNESHHGNAGNLPIIWQLNLLWPSHTISWHRSGWTLAQEMACCLSAPSHYLNQCWLIIVEVLWHSPEGNFTGNAHNIHPWYVFENDWFWITAASPSDQWVNAKTSPRCFHWRSYSWMYFLG